MKKEKIKIQKSFIDGIIEEGFVEGFEIVHHEQQTHDTDDGNIVVFVVKRLSDGKFFAGDYNWWGQDGGYDDYSRELEEVFPKEKTIIVYE